MGDDAFLQLTQYTLACEWRELNRNAHVAEVIGLNWPLEGLLATLCQAQTASDIAERSIGSARSLKPRESRLRALPIERIELNPFRIWQDPFRIWQDNCFMGIHCIAANLF